MDKIEKFTGLVAAPFTPFHSDDKLNAEIIPEYYSFLGNNGVTGVFINGTTGEGASLTNKEKQIMAKAWSDAMKSNCKMRVINLVGGTCYEECIEHAIISKEYGLSAIAVLTPYYFRPDEESLAEFIAKIGESVPEMPVYFYDIPTYTGVFMPMIGLMKRLSRMLPNFAGIKYTQENYMDLLSCLGYEGGKYDILWGRDECLLAALATGVEGAVGSTYNFAAPLYHAIIRCFSEGDMVQARKLQQKSVQIVELMGKYGGIAAGKSFMKYVGMDCGKFRLPVRNMIDEIYSLFEKEVREIGLGDYLSKKEKR